MFDFDMLHFDIRVTYPIFDKMSKWHANNDDKLFLNRSY